jgi:hypothetical protein
MKCTFCTNYSQQFLAKIQFPTQDFMHRPPRPSFFFSFFPEISGFISLRKEFSSVSSVSFSSFSRSLCHFVLRRFAQAPFSLP